ncbi:MAG: SAM-dependent methyltransferase [Planctomycetota bacterium]
MAEDSPSHGSDKKFVSRGGGKLDHALEAFGLDASGWRCADLGCSTGGFVDCLLQRGAAHVFAVDTAYGELAWKLRQDERVTVMERTNALHAHPPPEAKHRCDLVTLDLGWTKQDRALPAVLPWLVNGGTVVTLIKPHYESGQHRLHDDDAKRITDEVVARLPEWGWTLKGLEPSSVRGGRAKNLEYLAWLVRA